MRRTFIALTFATLAVSFSCGKQETSTPPAAPMPLPTISIHEAARTGNVGQLEAHFYYKSDVNLPDETGHTALQYATARGYTDIAKRLTDHGAKPGEKAGSAVDLIPIDASAPAKITAAAVGDNASYSFLKSPLTTAELSSLASGDKAAIQTLIMRQSKSFSSLSPADQSATMQKLLSPEFLPGRQSLADILVFLGRKSPPIPPSGAVDPSQWQPTRYPPYTLSPTTRLCIQLADGNPALALYLAKCREMPELYELLDIAGGILLPPNPIGAP